jgi:hypothetical protein
MVQQHFLEDSDCNLDLLIADIRAELKSRPYELVAVAPTALPHLI